MISTRSISLCATLAALAIFAGASAMQDRKPPAPAPPAPAKPTDTKPPAKPDAAQEQGHDMHATDPGPEHKFLAKYTGEFTTKSSFTVLGMPEQPAVTGTSKITSELGGRFFSDVSSGEMMGQKYESRHYTGYNTNTKEYESVWTWTMDTGMLHMNGTSDDGGKTITWNAEFTNEQGEKEKLKVINKYTDDDHFTIELRGEGEEGPVMTTEYTRKK